MTTLALTSPPTSSRTAVCRHNPSQMSYRLRRNDFTESSTPWRLTRRGRSLIAVALLIIVAAALILGAFRATAASTTPPPGWESTVVQPGDTLWSLASADVGQDPRIVIATIKSVNALTDSRIVPGQRLFVPR